MQKNITKLARRFRGLLPVVIDIETSGLHAATDGLLEIAAVMLDINLNGYFHPVETHAYQVEVFSGARIEKESLEITKIDPFHPFRFAIPEAQALYRLFSVINECLQTSGCYRAILVGHNAWFDLSFLLAAVKRNHMRYFPFHTFTTIDTASLGAVILGETVLAKAARRAKISFDIQQAHSAIYDAERTAELFCHLVNRCGKSVFS